MEKASEIKDGNNKILTKLLNEYPNLKQKYDYAMELVLILNNMPKIETLELFNSYLEKIDNARECVDISKKYFSLKNKIRQSTEYNEELTYEHELKNILSIKYVIDCLGQSKSQQDVERQLEHITWIYIHQLSYSYLNFSYFNTYVYVKDYLYKDSQFVSTLLTRYLNNNHLGNNEVAVHFKCEFDKLVNNLYSKIFLSHAFKMYIQAGLYSEDFRILVNGFINFTDSKIILALIKQRNRYNFFLQWHTMLEDNLPEGDQKFFYDYLKSCQEKLQNVKNKYKIFGRQIRNLTVIFIFGIVASAAVLTMYFLEIYASTWFFWFGIVGVVLTVAVGIRLGYCLWKNYNEIKFINQAIEEVYNLDKIRNFEEPEPKKIVTGRANENIINQNKKYEICTEEPNLQNNNSLNNNEIIN